jgi:8-oxo-dGTP pyrophosphatase MutT (NUDIX family)
MNNSQNHHRSTMSEQKEKLRQLLQNYRPTAEEQGAKDRMLAFLAAYDDCCKRELQLGHFTASAWLLSADRSKVLLMHHAKLNIWVQLGGHADGDFDLLQVACKEAQEESGIQGIQPVMPTVFDIDIHTIPARGTEPEHEHFDVRFLLQVTGDEQIIQNSESKELRWIDKDAATLPTAQRSVVRMFEKWKSL